MGRCLLIRAGRMGSPIKADQAAGQFVFTPRPYSRNETLSEPEVSGAELSFQKLA